MFKFSNLGLALGKAWKFYTPVTKGLKLKVKFCGQIPTLVEVIGKKLVGAGWLFTPSILNRVKLSTVQNVASNLSNLANLSNRCI